MSKNKILVIVLTVVSALLMGVTNVKAETPNEEMYNYFKNATYTIGGEEYRINSEQLVVLERYLNTHTLTKEQVTLVKGNIEKAAEILKMAGTIHIDSLTVEYKSKIEVYVQEVATALNLTIKYTSVDNSINIYENGQKIDVITLGRKKLVQTGHSYISYIALSAAVFVAVAGIILKNKHAK